MVGSLVMAGLTTWHPEPDSHDHFAYDVVEPIRTEWWAWHVFGGIGMAAAAVAASLAVCVLVPRRGAMLATTGAVLTSLGGLAFAAGIAAEGVLFAYATDTDALSAEAGRELMHHANENPALYVAAIIPGAILLTLGPLLLAALGLGAGRRPGHRVGRTRRPRAAPILALVALTGFTAGVAFNIQAVFMAHFGPGTEFLEVVEGSDAIGILAFLPWGLLAPFALAGTGFVLWCTRTVAPTSAALLMASGVLFIASRPPRVEPLAVLSDCALVLALTPIGWSILTRFRTTTAAPEPTLAH